jgi:hypothetical protein
MMAGCMDTLVIMAAQSTYRAGAASRIIISRTTSPHRLLLQRATSVYGIGSRGQWTCRASANHLRGTTCAARYRPIRL